MSEKQSRYGSPELQARIVARALEKDAAAPAQPDASVQELERENAALQHEFDKLKSPEGVRLAMLSGAIAKPSLRECAHAHGADALQALDKALAAAPAKSEDKTTIQEALSALKSAMSDDPEYAWSWHCNICMPIVDCGAASHKDANIAAARIMRSLFDVDMENSTRYVEWTARHTAPAQPSTHPTTGEPMGTTEQETTEWQIKAENLEREIKPLRLYENLAKEFGLEVFEGLAELQKDNVVLRMRLQSAMELIATPARPDGTWNRDRQACCKLAQEALSGIGPSSGMPDLTQLTERGAKAWAGVNAQDLREGDT